MVLERRRENSDGSVRRPRRKHSSRVTENNSEKHSNRDIDNHSETEQIKESSLKERLAHKKWQALKTITKARSALSNKHSEFLRSDEFVKMSNQAFDDCDMNGDGNIEMSELYAGVLLLYHNINRIPWGGRKPPPSKDQVIQIMTKYDLAILFKRALEEVLPWFSYIPDHMFTSAIVALLVTILPQVEAKVIPSLSWEKTAAQKGKQLRHFKKERSEKLKELFKSKQAKE